MVLGDFNARVGVLGQSDDLWHKVIGKHGLDEGNLAGENILQFCTANQLTVMNNWFQKKNIYYGTWMHPVTKKHHMIDLIVMRATGRVSCRDFKVMRGANCWTDHKMIRAKFRVRFPRVCATKDKIAFAVHELSLKAKKDEYRDKLEDKLRVNTHSLETSTEDNWTTVKLSTTAAAEESVGRERRNQPEWFEENTEVLTPLIVAKNKAYTVYLTKNTQTKKKEFRKHQRIVKKAVDKAKEE